jgi:CRP/FNR family transcriptional regulator, cyclic AMP receptor protein
MSFMDHLAPDARKKLENVAEQLVVGDKDFLMRRGELAGDFYRLERGSLEVVDASTRPVLVLDVVGPGTVVGEMGYLTGAPRSADVRAGEDSVVLRWKKETLDRVLDTNATLASAFYRASALLLSHRLQRLNSATLQGAMGGRSDRAAIPEDVRGARALADSLKSELRELEPALARTDEAEAEEALKPVAKAFLDSGHRLMAALSARERDVAGELLARELQPYLMRSQLARLAITRESEHTGAPDVLAHVELGRAAGADPLGKALDALLLAQPTAQAHRQRPGPMLDRVLRMLKEMRTPRIRVLVINAGTGAFIASLMNAIGETGGDITIVDGDRDALAFLNSGTATRYPKVRTRLVHEELDRLAMGTSEVFFGPHDVVVLNGLVEYLPDRVLASMLRKCRDYLLPTGGVVMDFLTPTRESFVFDHLLTWRTVRRPADSIVQFAHGLRYVEPELCWEEGCAAIVSARLPPDFQRTLPVLPVPR